VTIYSQPTNDNYRSEFDRIFNKKSDSGAARAASEKVEESDPVPGAIIAEELSFLLRVTTTAWKGASDSSWRGWSGFGQSAATVRKHSEGLFLWSTYEPDGTLLAGGRASTMAGAQAAADEALQAFGVSSSEEK
jgi:hypothetical protein